MREIKRCLVKIVTVLTDIETILNSMPITSFKAQEEDDMFNLTTKDRNVTPLWHRLTEDQG